MKTKHKYIFPQLNFNCELPVWYWDNTSEGQLLKEIAIRTHAFNVFINHLEKEYELLSNDVENHEIRIHQIGTHVQALQAWVDSFQSNMDSIVQAIYTRIQQERTESIARDDALAADIANLNNNLTIEIDTLKQYVDTQDAGIRSDMQTMETLLRADLATEEAARIANDNALIVVTDNLAVDIQTTQNLITQEVTNRTNADNRLESFMSANKDTTNLLVSYSDMVQYVMNNTGRWLTKDASGNDQFASFAELQGWTTFYFAGTSTTPSVGDRALYQNATDGSWMCSYDGTQWLRAYQVSSAPFSNDQMAAINSNITSALTAYLVLICGHTLVTDVRMEALGNGARLHIYSYNVSTNTTTDFYHDIVAGTNIAITKSGSDTQAVVRIDNTMPTPPAVNDAAITLRDADSNMIGGFTVNTATPTTITIPAATTAANGLVKYDGTTIKKNASGQLYADVQSSAETQLLKVYKQDDTHLFVSLSGSLGSHTFDLYEVEGGASIGFTTTSAGANTYILETVASLPSGFALSLV